MPESKTANMNSMVNRFYHDNVQLSREDAKKHGEIAFPNVEKILDYVKKNDCRFGKEPVGVGSYWSGLKVEKADEFDYDIVLMGFRKTHWGAKTETRYYGFNRDKLETNPEGLDVVRTSVPLPPPPTDYTYFPYHKGIWSKTDDLVREGDVVPFLVKRQLGKLITAAIRNLNLRGEVRQPRKSKGLTVTFKVGERNVSVDFAVVIRGHAPIPDWISWPRPEAKWPDHAKIASIKEIGINFVATREDFYWMYSFSEAEKELVAGIDIDGGKRKELHRVMKKLNTEFWRSKAMKTKPIRSYVLKNIWFWELEKYPDGQDWDNNHVWIRLESMTRALLLAIQTEKLPQYFHSAVNLIDYNKDPDQLAAAATKIQEFLRDPEKCLCDGLPDE